MDGLAGRKITPMPPDQREQLEELAQALTGWGHEHNTRATCPTCSNEWWRPRRAAGRACKKCCPHEGAILRGYLVKANGQAIAQALCLACGMRGDIRRTDTDPILDICFRNNVELDHDRTCARCGTAGVEDHHWAPRAIFNDADSWPTSPLCRRCHRAWHDAMRDARGVSLPPSRRHGSTPSPWYAA